MMRLTLLTFLWLFGLVCPVVAVPGLEETWGYLDSGDRAALRPDLPLTDVAVFAASINSRGQLVDVPAVPARMPAGARRHLVVAELANFALSHFVLDPVYPLRDKLVADLVAAASPYEGVQVDFESVARLDKANYLQFLTRLKRGLGKKTLSVAVPARWKAVDDAQDYAAIAKIADRVVVMAYDEHWSTSAPGAISSVEWASKVATYALRLLGPEKAVLGLPFYGRAWAEQNPAGGYRYSGVQRLLGEAALSPGRDEGGVPNFQFTRPVNYTVWFEDAVSLDIKTSLYLQVGVRKVAFWRLGQEDPAVWAVVQKKRGVPDLADTPRYLLRQSAAN
ncbi:MAG: glycosyl hydrolase family 18 protein [Spirochaetales bacterium]